MQTDKLSAPDKMAPAAMASLIDTALQCPHPAVLLDTVVQTLTMVGRNEDAAAVAWLAHLYDQGEVEALLSLRAAWRRGFTRDPADVARHIAALHR